VKTLDDLSSMDRPIETPIQDEVKREVRHRVSWPAHIMLKGVMRIDVRVIDVSLHGIALSCDVPFASGSLIAVVATVPLAKDLSRSAKIELPCRVQYHVLNGSAFRIGAMFQEVASANLRLLEQLLNQRARR